MVMCSQRVISNFVTLFLQIGFLFLNICSKDVWSYLASCIKFWKVWGNLTGGSSLHTVFKWKHPSVLSESHFHSFICCLFSCLEDEFAHSNQGQHYGWTICNTRFSVTLIKKNCSLCKKYCLSKENSWLWSLA